MNKEEIKIKCTHLYAEIQDAKDRLKMLREICKHEDTFEGMWEWRVGSTFPAIVCSHCGQLIKQL